MVTSTMDKTIKYSAKKAAAIQFKGSMYSLTVLQIHTNDLNHIQQDLLKLIEQAPKMFQHAPVIIDYELINQKHIILDLPAFCQFLKQFSLIPVGIIGGTPEQQAQAILANLALFPPSKQTRSKIESDKPVKQALENQNKLITQPVRSGQQIYVKGGDLIVLAAVSHGAEIIADGNIHIYGTLSGRALAGAQGDTNARIFCSKLDAELISIAGVYQLKDTQPWKNPHIAKQIFLDNERLVINDLNSMTNHLAEVE